MLSPKRCRGCLHHFRPDEADQVLADAARNRKPIGIFEGPPMVLLPTPRIRPVTLGRLIFTYLIPIFPVPIFWRIARHGRVVPGSGLSLGFGRVAVPDRDAGVNRRPKRRSGL